MTLPPLPTFPCGSSLPPPLPTLRRRQPTSPSQSHFTAPVSDLYVQAALELQREGKTRDRGYVLHSDVLVRMEEIERRLPPMPRLPPLPTIKPALPPLPF